MVVGKQLRLPSMSSCGFKLVKKRNHKGNQSTSWLICRMPNDPVIIYNTILPRKISLLINYWIIDYPIISLVRLYNLRMPLVVRHSWSRPWLRSFLGAGEALAHQFLELSPTVGWWLQGVRAHRIGWQQVELPRFVSPSPCLPRQKCRNLVAGCLVVASVKLFHWQVDHICLYAGVRYVF